MSGVIHLHCLHVDIARDPADLKLSDAQREIFAGWRRPYEWTSPSEHADNGREAAMFAGEDIDLVQDITTDCSVVASLCAGTARARKGHGKVLSPQLKLKKLSIDINCSSLLPCFTLIIKIRLGPDCLRLGNIYFA